MTTAILSRTALQWLAAVFCALWALSAAAADAEKEEHNDEDLTTLDLATLMQMDVKVTSVSKKEQPMADAAAAISVITQEDIRRSGALSIAEALRLVPGMEVARSTASGWQVSARGFQGRFSDKLLVLFDGRSVYTPTSSGVNWDAQDTVLEDIERIEVIRGPGASVWGANAVNGVINIVTRSARDTQGALVSMGGGTDRELSAAMRYGGEINPHTFLRAFVKRDINSDLELPDGANADDRWKRLHSGLRLDWIPSDDTVGTLQGDVQRIEENPLDVPLKGANVLGRWTRTLSPRESFSLQTYYDRVDRRGGDSGAELRDTVDVDFQHNFALGARHDIVWGVNYRWSHDDLREVPLADFLPSTLTTNLFGAFVQDSVVLVPQRLNLVMGVKLEHNDFTGVEVQPTLRLAWKPTGTQTVWGAVSRAVRTPNRFDTAIVFELPPLPRLLFGNPRLKSETLVAYDLGYRIQPIRTLSLDLAGYYNVYDDIKQVVIAPVPTQHNGVEGENHGLELSSTWQPRPNWKLTAFYSHIRSQFKIPPGTVISIPLDQPEHQAGLRFSLDLTPRWQLDVMGRYVDRWRSGTAVVPAYGTADVRLGFQATSRLELSVVGQNLFAPRHQEAMVFFQGTDAQVTRSVFARIRWLPPIS